MLEVRLACCTLSLVTASLAFAGPVSPGTSDDATDGRAPAAPLRQVDDHRFEIGPVQFDKRAKTLSFPATINMDQGVIEYVLVSRIGKRHESLLQTEAEPTHIHLAALLLRGKGTNAEPVKASADAVSIILHWKAEDAEKEARAEDWVFNVRTKAPMTRGPWIYKGSRILNGVFLAQRDGSIVSTIIDPDVLIENPRPGRDNDELWQVHTNAPAVGTAVRVTFQFEPRPDSGSGEQQK